MALVGSFTSRPHAEMAAAMLAGHGIRARVAGDDAGGVAPHWTFASSGGYAISVPDADRVIAEALLAGDEDIPADARVPEDGVLRQLAVRAAILLGLVGLAAGFVEASLG